MTVTTIGPTIRPRRNLKKSFQTYSSTHTYNQLYKKPNMLTSTVLSIAILLIPNVVGAHEGHPHEHQLEKRATLNGPCTGAGGAPGVCISTTDCTADGGTHILNACPGKAVSPR